MNRFIYIIFFFILSCSLNSDSAFWSKNEKIKTDKKITKILFEDIKPNEEEFNPKLKIKLPKNNINMNYDFNNTGFTSDPISGNNFSKYKFSKIENFSGFEPEILVDKDNIFFFDNKGSIINFNKLSKLNWKKLLFKIDKKNNPILFLASKKNNLFVADTNANYYLLNKDNGNLIWKKKHSSFNSQIKIKDQNIFVVIWKILLRCFSTKVRNIVVYTH